MEDLKQKVTDAINTTGYPLELFVSSVIEKNGGITWANQYFFDSDENQARSVDIIIPAFEYYYGRKTSKVAFGTDVVIECKKSPKTAWIFFERDEIVLTDYIGQITDYQQYCHGDYETGNLLQKFDENIHLHYGVSKNFSKIARNYQVVKFGETDLDDSTKNIKTKNTIFEAVNQVIKYIGYAKQEAHQNVISRYRQDGVYPLFNIHYPVIVFDGLMYNGFLKDDKIELEEREHIVLAYEFKPSFISRPKTFYIDVVKKEYLEKMLEILRKEVQTIQSHLDKNEKQFNEHAKTLKIPETRK